MKVILSGPGTKESQALGRNKHPDTHSVFLVALPVIFKWQAFKTSCRPLACNSQASRWCVSETKIHTSVFQIIHYDDVFYKPRTVSCYNKYECQLSIKKL